MPEIVDILKTMTLRDFEGKEIKRIEYYPDGIVFYFTDDFILVIGVHEKHPVPEYRVWHNSLPTVNSTSARYDTNPMIR